MLHSLESRNIHKLLPIPIGACRLEHRKIELSSLRPSGFKYTKLRVGEILDIQLESGGSATSFWEVVLEVKCSLPVGFCRTK